MEKQLLGFEKLEVYAVARKYVQLIYKACNYFPTEERFALSSQIKRAAISITSNIAEGNARISKRERAHFCEIAYGSLLETFSQLQNAQDLGYITEEQVEKTRPYVIELANKLTALRKSYLTPKTY